MPHHDAAHVFHFHALFIGTLAMQLRPLSAPSLRLASWPAPATRLTAIATRGLVFAHLLFQVRLTRGLLTRAPWPAPRAGQSAKPALRAVVGTAHDSTGHKGISGTLCVSKGKRGGVCLRVPATTVCT